MVIDSKLTVNTGALLLRAAGNNSVYTNYTTSVHYNNIYITDQLYSGNVCKVTLPAVLLASRAQNSYKAAY